jgi:hypothetical protein
MNNSPRSKLNKYFAELDDTATVNVSCNLAPCMDTRAISCHTCPMKRCKPGTTVAAVRHDINEFIKG